MLLDVKKFREEYALLQERAKALETRYAEMQSLTSQHLKDMSISHQKEMARLEETCQVQAQNHAQLIDEIKDHHEKMNQQHIATLDNIQVENKKSNDTIAKLQSEAQETFAVIKKLESDLRVLTVERDEAQNRLIEQDKKWSWFDNKTLVPDGVINKIYDAPTFDTFLDKINTTVWGSFDNKFIEIMEEKAKLFDYSKYLENIKEKQGE